jgi:hypothetical protein
MRPPALVARLVNEPWRQRKPAASPVLDRAYGWPIDDRVWDLIDDALADATDIRGLDGALASYELRAVRAFDTPEGVFMKLHDLETNASVAALALLVGSSESPEHPRVRASNRAAFGP